LSNASNPGHQSELKIQGRREALYQVIRESMTHGGILSASYKFKVLSLDRQEGHYLAMIELIRKPGDPVLDLTEMESQIIQRARSIHQATVCAVYWRLNETAAVALPSTGQATSQALDRKILPREPIQAEEIAAFRKALRSATAVIDFPETTQPLRSGLRSSNHSQDFGDTEAVPSISYPTLSTTQYGDLH
jgi:hypothetical protein